MRASMSALLVLVSIPAFASGPTPAVAQRMLDKGMLRLVNDAEPPSLLVSIESDNPKVELIRIAGGGVSTGYAQGQAVTVYTTYFEKICRAPCGSTVAGGLNNQFILGGDGITTSDAFDLGSYNGGVKIKVKAGNGLVRGLGMTATSLGFVGVLTGGTFLGLSAMLGSTSTSSANYFGTIGLVSGGAGLALLIPGIVMWAISGTSYQLEQGPAAPAKPAGTMEL